MARDLPLFPLELVLVPGEPLPLHIFEPRYQELLDRCVDGDEPFVLVLQDEEGMRDVACTAEITDVLERFPDGRANIITMGREVVRIERVHDEHAYRSAIVDGLEDDPAEAPEAAQAAALAAFAGLVDELPDAAPELPDPGPGLSYALIARIDLGLDVKQALLEDRDEERRLASVTELLREIHRGLILTRETQERARRNGRVRTPEELAAELGLE
ncbi:MAG: LON peptidase substrate-binding domain-containing protein [Gaiellales bacterium]